MKMEQKEFNKRRKIGLWILSINLIITLAFLIYYYMTDVKFINSIGYYVMMIYFIGSIFLLIRRIFKKTVTDESNYIFGSKLGDKMVKTPQKFILEAMLMSLTLIIITDIFSFIYAIFFTDIGIVYKVIAGVSGFFGAIFMTAILITTFIQYKQLVESQKFINAMTLNNAKIDIMRKTFGNPFKDECKEVKNGHTEKAN